MKVTDYSERIDKPRSKAGQQRAHKAFPSILTENRQRTGKTVQMMTTNSLEPISGGQENMVMLTQLRRALEFVWMTR
jgi:hypothetical protein